MWFTRWFGGRDDRSTAEEPSTTPAPRQPVAKAPAATAKRPQSQQLSLQPSVSEAKRKGFDPYNSGSFQRHNAWERVGRR